MKIFFTEQIKELDKLTIRQEPVSSINLMERASHALFEVLLREVQATERVHIFAGQGNNGGDALAVARMMTIAGFDVQVFLINPTNKLTPDCEENKKRLLRLKNVMFTEITVKEQLPVIPQGGTIIDGLFGSGLTRPVDGIFKETINLINRAASTVYAIDMPSGLFGEKTVNEADAVIKADYTLSFQLPKISFLFAENEQFVGQWRIIPIGLSEKAIEELKTSYFYTTKKDAAALVKKRLRFSHKGTFGHALLVAGSYGKMGASVLAAKACLRTGAGLLTVHTAACGNIILQTSVPEAMFSSDNCNEYISDIPLDNTYKAIGIGPGIGKNPLTSEALKHVMRTYNKPMVIDADAINLISADTELKKWIPAQSILTPHPKELERLIGTAGNSFENIQSAKTYAAENNVIIVLKGACTAIIDSEGNSYFNTTGNPGMATAGSGDVLTGIILSLLAQGYASLHAAVLGVYIHGLSGDLALREQSQESLLSSDIIEKLGAAFIEIEKDY